MNRQANGNKGAMSKSLDLAAVIQLSQPAASYPIVACYEYLPDLYVIRTQNKFYSIKGERPGKISPERAP